MHNSSIFLPAFLAGNLLIPSFFQLFSTKFWICIEILRLWLEPFLGLWSSELRINVPCERLMTPSFNFPTVGAPKCDFSLGETTFSVFINISSVEWEEKNCKQTNIQSYADLLGGLYTVTYQKLSSPTSSNFVEGEFMHQTVDFCIFLR